LRFDGQAWITYTAADGLASNTVRAIAVAPDGALWFGTEGGGVSRFDGEAWNTYATVDGLASNSVLAIAFAPDGAVWFGTWGGASRYLPPR
jgi:ligand-binding sensor domain-containing protein